MVCLRTCSYFTICVPLTLFPKTNWRCHELSCERRDLSKVKRVQCQHETTIPPLHPIWWGFGKRKKLNLIPCSEFRSANTVVTTLVTDRDVSPLLILRLRSEIIVEACCKKWSSRALWPRIKGNLVRWKCISSLCYHEMGITVWKSRSCFCYYELYLLFVIE